VSPCWRRLAAITPRTWAPPDCGSPPNRRGGVGGGGLGPPCTARGSSTGGSCSTRGPRSHIPAIHRRLAQKRFCSISVSRRTGETPQLTYNCRAPLTGHRLRTGPRTLIAASETQDDVTAQRHLQPLAGDVLLRRLLARGRSLHRVLLGKRCRHAIFTADEPRKHRRPHLGTTCRGGLAQPTSTRITAVLVPPPPPTGDRGPMAGRALVYLSSGLSGFDITGPPLGPSVGRLKRARAENPPLATTTYPFRLCDDRQLESHSERLQRLAFWRGVRWCCALELCPRRTDASWIVSPQAVRDTSHHNTSLTSNKLILHACCLAGSGYHGASREPTRTSHICVTLHKPWSIPADCSGSICMVCFSDCTER